MKKQMGISNGYLIAAVALILIVALTAGVHALHSYHDGIYKDGYNHGKSDANSKFEKDTNTALVRIAAERDALVEQVRGLEQTHVTATTALIAKFNKENTDDKRKYETTIAGLRAGSIVLRDNYAASVSTSSAGQASAGSAPNATGPSANGAGGCQLSEQTSEFLIGEANRADTVVRKFNAAVAQVAADRAACTARPIVSYLRFPAGNGFAGMP